MQISAKESYTYYYIDNSNVFVLKTFIEMLNFGPKNCGNHDFPAFLIGLVQR